MSTLLLKKGREHSLLRRHPWVFSGAVLGIRGPDPEPGETVDIADADGHWLARGAFSPESSILVRVWTFDETEAIDEAFFARRIAEAVALRGGCGETSPSLARRLVHGESDGLPGVVVDRYGDVIVVQLPTAGADRWRGAIVAALRAAVPDAATIYERSDAHARELEGLAPADGLLWGNEPPDVVEARWAGLAFGVPVRTGHKTGVYLDQAENLPRVGALAGGADVLDAFCYTGGFTMAALRGGAKSVTALDSSAPALDAFRANLARNGFDESRVEILCDDAFRRLRTFRDQGRSFDLIVLDPPKFAESRAQVERACRAYKDINLLAFKLLRPGGRLATFSCSGSVTPELFQKVVADAALDARRPARIVGRFSQAADHPVALAFPEGGYLKGLLCEVPAR
jgi:23S rRNA (cytosine1962-C5)-methyltransferase